MNKNRRRKLMEALSSLNGIHNILEICMNNSRNALRIMMAKRGKILKFDADSSTIEWLSAESPLTAYILIWCAEEVQRHGVPNKFVVPSIGRYGGGGMHWDVY